VRTSLNNGGDRTTLARLEQIEDGGFAEAEAMLDGDPESLILHRDGDAVRAWLNVCPHAGRRLDWAPGKFLKSKDGLLVCAVHGASFELQRGQCVAGPCRGDCLRAVGVEVRDGDVVLVHGTSLAQDLSG
jgi:nitrite reductase/ring-hydroxylating ferredoxin subunit